MKKESIKFLNEVGALASTFEAQRDYTDEGLSDQEQQFYSVLMFCFDLLARTDFNAKTIIDIPETAGYEGENTEFNPISISNDVFADAVFSLATKSGSVDMRSLLKRFMRSQKDAASKANIRQATISEYIQGKSAFNCDSYEKIINAYIQG